MHLFHLIIHDQSYTNDNDIEQFYVNYIKPMIIDKSNFDIIQYHLRIIANNSVIITNRSYQSLWKDVCGLFEIGVELAIEKMISKRNKLKHKEMSIKKDCKCNENEKCKKCKNKELFQMNSYKIENFEFEVIKSYNNSNVIKESLFDVIPQIDNIKDANTLSSDSESDVEHNVKMSSLHNENQLINSEFTFKDGNVNKLINIPQTFSYLKTNHHYHKFSGSKSIEYNNSINQFKLSFTGKDINTLSKNSNNSITPSVYSNNNNTSKKFKMKEFQFHFTKRENIDKYVLRKFRKYLKEAYKLGIDNQIISILTKEKFWYDFIAINLLPPFIYPYEYIEFKSFNTTYMVWLFSHLNSIELYDIFIKINMQELLNYFIQKYKLSQIDDEYVMLQNYLNIMAVTFCNNRTPSTESTLNTDYGMDCVFDKIPSHHNITKGGMMFNIYKMTNNENNKGNKSDCKQNELNNLLNHNCNTNYNEDNSNQFLNNNNDTLIDENESVCDYVINKEEIDFNMFSAY